MAGILGKFFDLVMRRSVAAFKDGLGRPYDVQADSLRRILLANAGSEFGKRHKFREIAQAKGADRWRLFRKAIPIRGYTDFAPEIERMKNGEADVLIPRRPDMFSLTSGTTSEPKFCPVNRAFIREHHRQHLLWMYTVYRDHPKVNDGKYLVAASPADMGRTAGGIPYGAMSGKQLDVQSIPVRRRMAVPALAQHLPDAADRWFAILLFALAAENLRVVTSVNPSTLVTMANLLASDAPRLLECLEKGYPEGSAITGHPVGRKLAAAFRPSPARAGKLRDILRVDGSLTPSAVWPDLEMILTWQGGASSFYLPHVAALWGGAPMRCLGLRASEGTFSIPLRDHTASGIAALGGHVMEFLPASDDPVKPDAPTLLAGQLEVGELYRLIITTSGGFYRYDLGDLVRVTGMAKKTPEIAFERRAGAVLSATGEKVTEDQVVTAMENAATGGPLMNGFSVTWEMVDGMVRYVMAMEWKEGEELLRLRPALLKERVRQLLAVFDDELMHRNCEYQSKRDDGRIAPPRAVILADGSYATLRSKQAAAGKPENQVKNPVLIRPPAPGRAPVPGCAFFDAVRIVAEL